MNELTKEYMQLIETDRNFCEESFRRQVDYIKNSTAKYHGRVVRTLAIPKIFNSAAAEDLKNIAETMHTILCKVIKEYLNNPDFRKLFLFDSDLEKLILTDCGYESLLPVARVDIFYNEDNGDFKLCEINTDGTSAMNEDRELNISVKGSAIYNRLKEKFSFDSYELFDSFVERFMGIYDTFVNKKDNPNIAIVDFLDHGTVNEFEQFRLAFIRAGYNAVVCDIKDLKYDDHALYTKDGLRIDAIYRRAVTCDIMNDKDSLADFLNAVINTDVCLIGGMRTQIAHSKILFKVLTELSNPPFLTKSETEFIKKHVPKTYLLTTDNELIDFENVYKNYKSWIIKPVDSYASMGVHAGVECESPEEWKGYVDEALDKGYIIQEFVEPYITQNTDFSGEALYADYSNLTGLFLYDGDFAGIYSRVSKTEIISTQYSEITLPSVIGERL